MSTWKRTDKDEGIALLRLPGTNWSEEFGRNIAGLKKKKSCWFCARPGIFPNNLISQSVKLWLHLSEKKEWRC